MDKLSHIDGKGKAKMVDISHKKDQVRMATATGFIQLEENTIMLIRENEMKKGDVLGLAEIAGIQGAKKTSDLIPLCHPLGLSSIIVSAVLKDQGVEINAEVKSTGPTGVEMEALTAVQIALLTIYDMCKAVDKNMVIGQVRLIEKTKKDI
jgi:cyclic pyranopterin phosphate synthase